VHVARRRPCRARFAPGRPERRGSATGLHPAHDFAPAYSLDLLLDAAWISGDARQRLLGQCRGVRGAGAQKTGEFGVEASRRSPRHVAHAGNRRADSLQNRSNNACLRRIWSAFGSEPDAVQGAYAAAAAATQTPRRSTDAAMRGKTIMADLRRGGARGWRRSQRLSGASPWQDAGRKIAIEARGSKREAR
jgi:hypothetical protein